MGAVRPRTMIVQRLTAIVRARTGTVRVAHGRINGVDGGGQPIKGLCRLGDVTNFVR